MRWQTLTIPFVGITMALTRPAFGKTPENWTHFGLRPLGMGNAYVAVADDYNSIFYNPAGLARLDSWDGEFFNPSLSNSADLGNLVGDAQSKLKSGNVSDSLDLIKSNTGKSYHVGLSWSPHLVFKNFGFGIGTELSANMIFHRNISTDFDTGIRVVAPFAWAMNFLDKKLSVGMAFKARLRAGVDREFSIDDIESFKSSNKDTNSKEISDYVISGIGYGTDIGMLFTPTKKLEPTLGISVTDLGGTPYTKMNAGGTSLGNPQLVLPSLNIGMSLKPVQKDKFYVLTSIDMHSINQPYSFSKKLNLGSELGLGSIVKLQAGLHQGYLTGGIQFDLGFINLRAITYSEELGAVAGFREDRRYAVQLKFLF